MRLKFGCDVYCSHGDCGCHYPAEAMLSGSVDSIGCGAFPFGALFGAVGVNLLRVTNALSSLPAPLGWYVIHGRAYCREHGREEARELRAKHPDTAKMFIARIVGSAPGFWEAPWLVDWKLGVDRDESMFWNDSAMLEFDDDAHVFEWTLEQLESWAMSERYVSQAVEEHAS